MIPFFRWSFSEELVMWYDAFQSMSSILRFITIYARRGFIPPNLIEKELIRVKLKMYYKDGVRRLKASNIEHVAALGTVSNFESFQFPPKKIHNWGFLWLVSLVWFVNESGLKGRRRWQESRLQREKTKIFTVEE